MLLLLTPMQLLLHDCHFAAAHTNAIVAAIVHTNAVVAA